MVTIRLSDEAASLLTDVIDLHVAGIADSKNLTELDPTVATAEQLLDLMSGYDDDMLELVHVRRQLNPPKPCKRKWRKAI